MANRETSPKMSSLAGKIMGMADPFEDEAIYELIEAVVADPAGPGSREAIHARFGSWVTAARKLAGSVLSQDETPGQDRVIGKHPALAAPYTPSLESKISVGLRGLAKDMIDYDADIEAGTLMERLDSFADRANGYAAELEAPISGTHAYELIAQMERANVNTTETLIHMVAATVLSKLIEDEAGGRSNISFSPKDMDAMYRDYEMSATRDGLLTTVRIVPRPSKLESHAHHDIIGGVAVETDASLMFQQEDVSNAKPQAEAKPHDRPVWAVRYYAAKNMDGLEPFLAECHDKADAERQLPVYQQAGDRVGDCRPDPVIENRMCTHVGCPTEQCLEVTSG